MRDEDGARFLRERRFQQIHVDVVRADFAIDEDRHQLVLHDGGDGGGEGRGGGDDLVAGFQRARNLPRAQRRHRHQIGRRSGVDREDALQTHVLAQPLGERLHARAIGEPEVEHGLDGALQFALVVNASAVVDKRLAGDKVRTAVRQAMILCNFGKYFPAQRLCPRR